MGVGLGRREDLYFSLRRTRALDANGIRHGSALTASLLIVRQTYLRAFRSLIIRPHISGA